ncbi:MAG: ash family protein [[Actinobacillus] rossii]|nr:ash family protein [[Actinobacillus] rossii]
MKLTNAEYSIYSNIFHDVFIEKTPKAIYSCAVVAKSTAEPENSNNLLVANNSAPCAFFIRGLHTPKESAVKFDSISSTYEINQSKFGLIKFLSMVACNGKGFALCCVPQVAVSQPVTRYRPKPENFKR